MLAPPASGRGGGAAAPRTGTVVAWSLYELGATAFAMNVLSLHLPLDIATRVPRGNEKFSLVFGLSMAAVALAAPFLGRLADEKGKRAFLLPFVLAGVGATALLALPGPVGRLLFFFAVANVAYQCGYVFYNALLPDVAAPESQGRVAGLGVAAGYFGSLFGMFLVLPFVSEGVRAKLPAFLASAVDALSVKSVAGVEGFVRVNAYLPTAALWLLAAAPLLFLARLPRVRRAPSGRSPFADVAATVRSLPRTPAILWFLVSSLLYVDVVHTVQIQISTYSRFAAGLTDGQVQVFLLVCTAVAVLGGFLYGALCQRVTIRTAILVTFVNWLAAFVVALVAHGPGPFWAVGVLAGIGLGGVKVTSKLGLIALVPQERLTEFFGFYTLAGEAASVAGPFLWAATLALFPDRSPAGYRAALAVLLVVLVLSAVTFLKVRFPEGERRA